MPSAGTELQAKFAAAFVRNGGNATAAAIEAGYSEKSASDLGRRALESPHVHGLGALVEVAQSDKAPAAAKVAAGRALLEFAGFAGSSREADDSRWRSPGAPAPDYKAILDTFANISALAVRGTVQ